MRSYCNKPSLLKHRSVLIHATFLRRYRWHAVALRRGGRIDYGKEVSSIRVL